MDNISITAVEFAKNWTEEDVTSEAYFPTQETNERQVRADMQELHNEMRDYVNNTMIPEVVGLLTQLDADKATRKELSEATIGQYTAEVIQASVDALKEL